MRPDGSQATRIAPGEEPAWSPDGKQIAFAWTQDHNSHRYIYLMNADGSDVVRLTDGVSKEFHPSWSPDGRHIAFDSFARSEDRLCVVRADGTNLQCLDLASLANPRQPAWSPDGSQIAISAKVDSEEDTEIFVVSAECIDVVGECEPSITRLTDNEVIDDDPAWSPDGKSLLFSRHSEPGWATRVDIWVMNANGTDPARLTGDETDDTRPAWSPDGKRIVFAATAVSDTEAGTGRLGAEQIVVMNIDDSSETRLTEGGLVRVKGEDSTPPIGSWDPDW
jgi:TolB protein